MRLPFLLGFVYFGSELLLTVTRRSRGTGGIRQDRSTLLVLWIIIMASIAVSIYVATHWRAAALPYRNFFIFIGLALFVMGLVVRWWAIIVLGRFFTVDVSIVKDHQLVTSGPYRLVRHPSYTGVLLAFVGLGLSFANWATFLVLVVPIFAAFFYRMKVEEEALSGALGESYAGYMRRTKRLVPGVY